ncbi:MAG TPA: ArsC family transcriptional regulator [Coriobacteriia bacterium]|nr:ArsC family transcriptional regulator [Coriobacteriia bacterium]
MLFVCYPRCSTCAKARTWLNDHKLAFTERDIKLDNPTEQELRTWHEASGFELKKFFNTSGIPYRELGLAKKLPAMSTDEQYALLATNGMLVKRPLVVTDEGKILTGFKEAEWAEVLL